MTQNLGSKSIKQRIYWKIKKKIFPIYPLLDIIPKVDTILDIGCGNGTFSYLISQKFPESRITGIDIDSKKIESAKKLFGSIPNLDFYEFDLLTGNDLVTADLYLLIDVLYLLPYDIQKSLIINIVRKMKDKDFLLIKECNTKPALKFLWNYCQESISVRLIGWTQGKRFYFLGEEDSVGLLKKAGLDVESIHLDKGYLYPHIVYFCRKRSS